VRLTGFEITASTTHPAVWGEMIIPAAVSDWVEIRI